MRSAGSPRDTRPKESTPGSAYRQPSHLDVCTQAVCAGKTLLTRCRPLPQDSQAAPGCPAASGMGSLSLSPGPETPFPSPLGLWDCRWEEAGFSVSHITEPMSSVKCHSGTGRTARTVTYSGAMISSLNEKP